VESIFIQEQQQTEVRSVRCQSIYRSTSPLLPLSFTSPLSLLEEEVIGGALEEPTREVMGG
jgi:hypothetical protein